MQEFLSHQSERKLRHSETLVDYIYAKDALLEKAPFTIPQPDHISMIIGDITEEKWQIALATQNSITVEELIDRATALDKIRSTIQDKKPYQSPKSQMRSFYSRDEQRHKYNPSTDDVRNITCWHCGDKGHASFMCSLPPPERGSPIAPPRNTSRQIQDNQINISPPSTSGLTSSHNKTPRGNTSSNFSDSSSNTNRNSTNARSMLTKTNNSNSINCIKTNTNKRALIPVIINNDTEIQALCDPCADITVIQQSYIPSDIVIHPWTDGEFQVVDHEIKPTGWISLDIKIGNIKHIMLKIGICAQLPFPLILGFDWQQQIQARCTYDPNGSLCISTPSSLHLYECIHAAKPSINCLTYTKLSLPPMDDVDLPEVTLNPLPLQKQHFVKSEKLSVTQQTQLDAVIGKFADVFYSDDGNIGSCPSYSPQANSIVERANGIIVSTSKKMIDKNPEKWDLLLPNALLAINTTKQNSTGKSPFYLLHVYEPRLPPSHSFQKGDLVLYDWPKQDHKLSPIFKGSFVIVRPVGAVCYEIKSTTPGYKVLKVVHVQHPRPYFKRESPTIEEDDSSEEESESTAEMKDPADDLQGMPNVTEL
ncbi:uncharacterized protein TNCT_466241 [Trichonephila clavata]|uniref:Retropepsins domain-containing protein n=1 Tax=Trichonephila clavata TaxID=2740835 RepID=A0A8X6L1M4_TRICU|nr:uncharacterized protein TNCT_466241 [Trichonephila clavata]